MRKFNARWFQPKQDCTEAFTFLCSVIFPAIQLACLRFDAYGNAWTDDGLRARIKEVISAWGKMLTPDPWDYDKSVAGDPLMAANREGLLSGKTEQRIGDKNF